MCAEMRRGSVRRRVTRLTVNCIFFLVGGGRFGEVSGIGRFDKRGGKIKTKEYKNRRWQNTLTRGMSSPTWERKKNSERKE